MFREKHVISLWEINCVFLGRHNEDPYTVALRITLSARVIVMLQCVYLHLAYSWLLIIVDEVIGYVVVGELDTL